MTSSLPPLIVFQNDSAETPAAAFDALRERYNVKQIRDVTELAAVIDEASPKQLILLPANLLRSVDLDLLASGVGNFARYIGEGAGIVHTERGLIWANDRLRELPERARREFVQYCQLALEVINEDDEDNQSRQASRKFTFKHDPSWYELSISPVPTPVDLTQQVDAVVGVLWDITATKRLQNQIDAIDAAGTELFHFDPDTIAKLDVTQRLQLLEHRIAASVGELLHFDHFEVRLLDRRTNKLELVFSRGLPPMAIGRAMYAEAEGNGICGYVAVTGESYICPDTSQDPRYEEGLADAASTLTVPLTLHDRIVGVFNIESKQLDAFDENDRRFAEIFGRYIAMAMHILDLMVIERYTTNERLSESVFDELSEPLNRLRRRAQQLSARQSLDAETRQEIEQISREADLIRQAIRACTAGPHSILQADRELADDTVDPVFTNRRVLVCDDEKSIRETVAAILRSKGCHVTVCSDGTQTLDALQAAADNGNFFELVVSDVKMPGANGFEVFRATQGISATTPVILMTGFGYDPNHSIIRSSQEGLHATLFKPFTAQQFVAEAKRALAKDNAT